MTATIRSWRLREGRVLALDVPRVMGILNVTPDSFSDGGLHAGVEEAVRAALRMVEEGAAVIDIGGESTRPGAERVSAAEQKRRILPVIREFRGIRERSGVLMTVDTTSAEVAAAGLEAGADAINDVSAGMDDERMLRMAARRGVGIVLMHRLRAPGSDVYSHQYAKAPEYPGGVVESVKKFLAQRVEAALAAGVGRDSIVLDPGLGFGKSVQQNLELIEGTGEIAALGYPVLSGLSRKSFTGVVGGVPPEAPARDRLDATLDLSVRHLRAGARIFRVHDVREHVRALGAAWAEMGQ